MRNLKKLLALVLAMVMAFSLMLSAGAVDYKDYPDKDNITEEFKEAVQVLTGMKVFQGDEGGFRPGDTITRAEVAAIIYRIATGDVEGKQVKIYADYGNFTDVPRDEWFAGYVGYCANAQYIKGTSPTTFNPYDSVTGYQALAMILRVVGYDKNGEFTGPSWQTNVASLSKNLGITNNVKNANFETTLTMSARRDVVADLLFQTAVSVPTVTYTPALSYSDKGSLLSEGKNPTLGQKTFGLFCEGEWKEVDKWGRPGYYWAQGGEHLFTRNSAGTQVWRYDSNWLPKYGATVVTDKDSKDYNLVATIIPAATKTYDTAVRECDVAHDLDFDGAQTFDLHVNSKTTTAENYTIQATDTVTRVGGQGRVSEFWYKVKSPYAGSLDNWAVMVDTYLAKVTGVTAPVLDKAGHVIVPAKLNLDVYDGPMSYSNVGTGIGTNNPLSSAAGQELAQGKFPSKHVATQDDPYEWSVGDMLLVQGYTDYSQYWDNDGPDADNDNVIDAYPVTNDTGLNHLNGDATAIEKTAYETNVLKYKSTEAKISVLGKADMKLGKQTKTYWNADKHNVDSTDYNDQLTLFLDRAKTDTNVTWAWYFDTKGNLIGIDEAPSNIQYGVITSIYSAFNQGDSYTDGTTKAIANVLMADGTTQTMTIDRFLMGSAATAGGRYDLAAADGGKQMLDVTGAPTTGDNIELIPQYDYDMGTDKVMKAENVTTGTAHNAKQKGNLFVAPVTSVNELKENGDADPWTATGANAHYGIIRGNMFKFVNTTQGMTAVEVAGAYDASHNDENTGIYEWMYHDLAVTADSPKLTKSLGILKVNAGKTITVSNSTKIMVRSSDDDKVITCYDGLSKLPGDVTIAGNSEVDWVDFNGDGRVDYVYLTGRVSGTTTYGLFYYNGGAATWFGTEKKGEIEGWLNGEATTVTFNDQDEFNLIKNHTSNVDALNYRAHLFALQIMNGVVSDVMYNQDTTAGAYLLADSPNAPEIAADTNTISTGKLTQDGTNPQTTTIKTSNAADMFGLGGLSAKWGNPYDANTGIVYHKDANLAPANTVAYVPGNSTVVVNGTTYYVTENSKIIGLGRGVSYGENVLYYLNECDNDVTIVYDESMTGYKVIREIYVATDPDWTPGGVTTGVTFGPDITAAPTGLADGTDPGSVGAWLKNFKNGVFYCSDHKVNAGDAAGHGNLLYFPFVMSTAAPVPATLTIMDNYGNIRFSETGTPAAVGANIFRFDFLRAPGAWVGPVGLSAGTYRYDITVNSVSVSNGTFTLISK